MDSELGLVWICINPSACGLTEEKECICIEASNSTELWLFTCECDVDFDTKSPNRRKNGAKEKNLLRSLDYKYWVCCVRVTTA